MLDLNNIDILNRIKEIGFILEDSILTKHLGELDILISEANIIIHNTTNLIAETLEPTMDNLIKVSNMKPPLVDSEYLDTSIPKYEADCNNLVSEKNKSDSITRDEASNAGFKQIDSNQRLQFESLQLTLRSDRSLIIVYNGGYIKSIKNATKQQVNEVYYFFTQKHLDFVSKVYDWEGCCIRPDAMGNIYPTKSILESTLAQFKLSHIISRINVDFPAPEFVPYGVTIDFDLVIKPFYPAPTPTKIRRLTLHSQGGAEILIRDNKELLKTYFQIK